MNIVPLNGSTSMLTLIVGPFKTGSTSVESLLVKMQAKLVRDGILLCNDFKGHFGKNPGEEGRKNAANLGADLTDNQLTTHNVEVLRKCLSNKAFSEVIVATETLSQLGPGPAVDWLLTARPRIRAVVSKRNMADWLRSCYHQWGNRASNEAFKDWFHRVMDSKGVLVVPSAKTTTLTLDFSKINPFGVAWSYQNWGIPVVEYEFMNVEALLCSILQSNSACNDIRKGTTKVPTLNAGQHLHNKGQCLPPSDIKLVDEYFTKEGHVPEGQNWGAITCS
mmetsp:Transcript_29848/g.50431  ORF Transcript_29848/g.50431 Transcript_29848/m.50431 type:complete len:278 (-) Transcript_29848:270-1103(-)